MLENGSSKVRRDEREKIYGYFFQHFSKMFGSVQPFRSGIVNEVNNLLLNRLNLLKFIRIIFKRERERIPFILVSSSLLLTFTGEFLNVHL